ncbi:MAG TPA: DHA2 family efflux MFS transporter permease subunit [Microlunatus sp.]|nr:DHA2 family efflux MFS transporter permease subunit [Microlunatus sp.]
MTTTTPEIVQTGRMTRRDRNIIATLLVATFVVILNETIMSVALPTLMVDLGIDANTAQWLSTAFMLTMAVVIPTTGFLLQRLSTRTVYVLALSLFCAGTTLAALAPGFWVLLLARVIQACGTATMLPLLMTTILNLVPVERRGVVMGNIGIAISVAPALGPTLSGLILQYFSWRFMFVAVLPIAVAALVYGALRLVNVGEPGHQRLDVVSVLLTVPAFGGLVYGLSRLTSPGGAPIAIVSLVVGVLCLIAFGLRQRSLTRADDSPLLDLRAFDYRMFKLSVVVLCVAMVALFGSVILLPIYLQTIRGLTSLETGLLVLPGGVLMGVLGPIVGRLLDRYGPPVLAASGGAVLVLALLGLSTVDATTPIWQLLGLHMAVMASLAFLFTPAFTSGLNPLPPHLYSHGSAILTTLQQVAGAAGTAVLVMIMTARAASLVAAGVPQAEAVNGGIELAFAVAAVIAIGAAVCAAFLRNPVPAHPHGAVEPVPAEVVPD